MLTSYPVPTPYNEPVRAYAPGTAERTSVRAKLKAMSAEVREIPLWINGEEVPHRQQAYQRDASQACPTYWRIAA